MRAFDGVEQRRQDGILQRSGKAGGVAQPVDAFVVVEKSRFVRCPGRFYEVALTVDPHAIRDIARILRRLIKARKQGAPFAQKDFGRFRGVRVFE